MIQPHLSITIDISMEEVFALNQHFPEDNPEIYLEKMSAYQQIFNIHGPLADSRVQHEQELHQYQTGYAVYYSF